MALSAALALALALLASRGRAPGQTPFVCLMLTLAIWSLGYGIEISSTSLESAQFWLAFEYLGIPFIGVCWWWMVRELTGAAPLSVPTQLALIVPGILLCLLAVTNQFHGWVHADLRLDTSGPIALLRFERAPGYWLMWVYSWGGLVAGLVQLWRARHTRGEVFRRQVRLLYLAACIPAGLNLAYTAGLRPWGALDLTPFAFSISGALLAWGVFRVGLFDLVGVARARVLEQLQDGVLVCDDKWRVVDFNPLAAQFLGPLELGQPLTEVRAVWPRLREMIQQGLPGVVPPQPDGGSGAVVEAVVTPLVTEEQVRGMLVVLRDVSSWVRVQSELQRREQLLIALSESTRVLLQANGPPDIAAYVQALGPASGADRTYVFLNEFREDGALCTSQVAEWCAPGVIPQLDNPQLQRLAYDEAGLTWWRQTLAAGRPIHARVAELPAAERAALEPQGIQAILCFPLMTDRGFGGFIGFDNCHSDELWGLAEREYLQSAALNLSQALQRQQTEAALRQAQKLEVVGRLAAGIVHDFNNLLQVVIGYAEMLRAAPGNGRGSTEAAEQIYRAGLRAAQLTAKLLAFTRSSPVVGQGCDLNSQLRELRPLLVRLLRENLRLELHLEAADPGIAVTATHLEQIVFNLVVNARDAIPGSGVITLLTRNLDVDAEQGRARGLPAGRYTVLQVEDTGRGMDESVLAHLFEPFFSTKPFGQGAGMGLATVHGLVQQYHGHITVSSEPGRGSRFTLLFPTTAVPAPAPESAAAPAVKERATILVVEDDAGVRRLLEAVLRQAGYVVLTAPDGATGLETLHRHPAPVHLLLTDAVMPHMDGPTLILRARQERPGLPALLLSGYPEEAFDRPEDFPADVELLSKPIRAEALLTRVHALLHRRA